jgi:hypothetical protein
MPATSSRVRATDVTAMPSRSPMSAPPSERERCATIPGRARRPAYVGTVTWIDAALDGRSSQSAAALTWLSTALLPVASSAAIHHPSRDSRVCPTANTPRWSRCRRPARTRWLTAPSPSPAARSTSRSHDPVLRRRERGDPGVGGSPGVDVLHVST